MMNGKFRFRLKYLWKFAKPYKWSFINAFLCIFFTSILSMTYPYVFGLLVDEVFYNKNMKFFLMIMIIYALIYFTAFLLYLIQNILWPYQVHFFLLEVRKKIYLKLMSMKYERLVKMPIGDMIGKINWEAEAFVELLHRNFGYLLSNTIRLLTIITIVFFINERLALLLIIMTPISYITSYKFGTKVGIKSKKVRDKYMAFLGWIFEILSGLREIKLFGAEDNVSAACCEKIMLINKQNVMLAKTEVLSDRICEFISLITNISLYVTAGLLIYYKKISLGSFIAVISYFEVANSLLKSINGYWGKLNGNIASIDDLVDLFETEEEDSEKKPDIVIESGKIEFADVCFFYDNKEVIRHLSFIVNQGSCIAVVGKSGAGKSTIANIILGLLQVDKGKVLIDGQNVKEHNLYSLREQIGVVQQDIYIFDGTIRENLLLAAPEATDEQIMQALYNADLMDYIKKLKKGLDTVIGPNGVSMSGGEKQRLSIARLFLQKAKIIIFDEATSSLDVNAEQHVKHAWKKLGAGKTTIIIAHRLSTILSADKIIVIDGGKMVGYDTHARLLEKNFFYQTLIKEQFVGVCRSGEVAK